MKMKTNYRAFLTENLLDARMRTVSSQWRTTIRRSKESDDDDDNININDNNNNNNNNNNRIGLLNENTHDSLQL